MTLLEFLEARLAEDEAVARAAAALGDEGHWAALDNAEWYGPAHPERSIEPGIGLTSVPASGSHIARHDPARVLAELVAKRRLIDIAFDQAATIDSEYGCSAEVDHDAAQIRRGECPDWPSEDLPLLRILALPYASHPDFETRWAVVPAS